LFGLIPGTDRAEIAWVAAVLVSALGALIFGALSLRTTGLHFIMITLAFAQMLYFFFVSLKIYGGDDGLILRRRNALGDLDMRDATVFYYICFACLAVFLLLCQRLVNSRFGRMIQGIRQNPRRMAALGADGYRYRLACFVIAGAGAGLAGALLANHARFVSPDMMHWTKSGELMIMVILGGAGTLFGPVLGAALLLGLETALTSLTEHWMFVLGPLLVLIVLFARRGLWGFLTGGGNGRG
jgi:branched-chain amino acid transport system permease protein